MTPLRHTLLQLLACILVACAAAGCAGGGEGEATRVYATIVSDGGRYVLVADTSGTRYVPTRIPLSYREDGLKVTAVGLVTDGRVSAAGDSVYAIELTSLVERVDD